MKLAEYLEATGAKVAAFAEQVGVSDTSVYRWINRTRTPTPEQMRVIYRVTKGLVQPNDLVLA